MVWYQPPDDSVLKYIPSDDPNYVEWDTRQLTEIDRKNISNKPVLIRTDVPHDIKSIRVPRWCISIRGGVGDVDIAKGWDNVVDAFNRLGFINESI
jgi:hypothetical protein